MWTVKTMSPHKYNIVIAPVKWFYGTRHTHTQSIWRNNNSGDNIDDKKKFLAACPSIYRGQFIIRPILHFTNKSRWILLSLRDV